jgi:NADPH:quinone reductase-like Zn-dependent oxidoreductase
VLIKVIMTGVNPTDHLVVSGMLPKIVPFSHISGAESSGIMEQVGIHIDDSNIQKEDGVIIHTL